MIVGGDNPKLGIFTPSPDFLNMYVTGGPLKRKLNDFRNITRIIGTYLNSGICIGYLNQITYIQ